MRPSIPADDAPSKVPKPHAEGGLELGRITSSLAIAALMVVGIVITSARAMQLVHATDRERT